MHKVLIIGGGFGGLYAAKSLRRVPVSVQLVDRRNFHLFQPLLYQVATGGLSPANIAAPLRSVLKRQRNAEVLLGNVVDIDVERRRVVLAQGELDYDSLIVASGARHCYFGNDNWEPLAPGLKTLEDATEMRRRVFLAFEGAELQTDPTRREPWLTFVVVGGGPTGVELAGALGELAHHTLRNDFRNIDTTAARVLLLEGGPRILPSYPEKLSENATTALTGLGVTVRTGVMVTDIAPGWVEARSNGQVERIQSRTILWGAGVQASRLGNVLADRAQAPLDRVGRVIVEPDLTITGHPEIFVIGDLAHFAHQPPDLLPGIAPVAMQQGRYAARLIAARLVGRTLPPFHYRHRGSMATIGRAKAVADLGWARFGGFLAWLTWLFVHVLFLIEFQNRLLVMTQWAWSYITRNRAARLITGSRLLPAGGDDVESERPVTLADD